MSERRPTYRIEYKTSDGFHLTSAIWHTTSRRNDAGKIIRQGLGSPTDSNISRHVRILNASFACGGINYDERRGTILIVSARVIRQTDSHVTAEWFDTTIDSQETYRIRTLSKKLSLA